MMCIAISTYNAIYLAICSKGYSNCIAIYTAPYTRTHACNQTYRCAWNHAYNIAS